MIGMQEEPITRAERGWGRGPGGIRELLRIAWPLILSNSFLTLQITIDRVLLGRADLVAVAASMPAAMLFWTPMTLLQFTVTVYCRSAGIAMLVVSLNVVVAVVAELPQAVEP